MRKHNPPAANPAASDSPWFWALLFCSVALVAIVTVGPKFARRQAQLERRAEVRERIAYGQPTPAAGSQTAGEAHPSGLRRLAPLTAVVAAGWTASWLLLRRDLRRGNSRR
jgi:hypothetical protein